MITIIMSKVQLLLIMLPLLCLQQHLGSQLPDNPSPQLLPRCHEDEAAALLEFKHSFVINQNCIDNPFSTYVDRKLEQWKIEGNCCTWGGIECDVQNGKVIGLDLSHSCLLLHGSTSINSRSSLFRLLHLQKLNLAFIDFNHSHIPAAIGNFSRLTSLNLSFCSLAGPVPNRLFSLTNLTSLDLSENLELKLNLENLVPRLTKLEALYLSNVNIASPVPNLIANLSSLKFLTMAYCELQGEFPSTIFNLPKLQVLDVSDNFQLLGHLPELESSRPLKYLSLRSANFSGELPISLGNLGSLIELDLSNCGFKGFIPSSIANLTELTRLFLGENKLEGPPLSSFFGNMTHLAFIDFSSNQLTSQIPPQLLNLSNLELLDLHSNQLNGQIPSSSSLGNLNYLDLNSNQLSGQIPSSFGNLVNLEDLYLNSNQLSGQIPSQLSNLTRLAFLDLSYNKLRGTVHLDMFLAGQLDKLQSLVLSSNTLSVIANTNGTGTAKRLEKLELVSCKLREFPILQNVTKLSFLDLSDNDIHGPIPLWILNGSFQPTYLNLSHNHLTSFPQNLVRFEWTFLQTLDLSFNQLQGSPPLLPSESINNYLVSDNKLSGDISSLICNLSNIRVLDLANNNFTGAIPQCLSNSTEYLEILSLHGNSLFGRMPEVPKGRCDLQMVDLSGNQLDGPLPRSLSSCTSLQFLNLGNNMLSDTFPSWLGSVDALMVLILRSNKFHGAIKEPKVGFEFPGLNIIDLSRNFFNGHLPSKYFKAWNSTSNPQGYLVTVEALNFVEIPRSFFYYTMTLMNKGINTEYQKILDYFKAIDLSSNNFSGSIPTSIGDVRGLHLLNLSYNHFIGPIPPALGGLTDLEALDLSENTLSGDIPQQLKQLKFLTFLNVSENNLSGSIPLGKQFSTFTNDSYEGNEGLCGDPLSRKCGNSSELPPSTLEKGEDDEDSEMPFYIEWKAVVVGYISAFIIAALIVHCTITVRQNWFVIIFRLKEQRRSQQERYNYLYSSVISLQMMSFHRLSSVAESPLQNKRGTTTCTEQRLLCSLCI